MYRATLEQVAEATATEALASVRQEVSREERIRLIRQKSKLIYSLTNLAGNVVPLTDDRRLSRTLDKTTDSAWEHDGTSRPVAVPTEAESPQMGATITAYRTGFAKDKFLRVVDSGDHVTAADVNVGVLHESVNQERRLIGATAMLRVTLQPPAVYWAGEEGVLHSIEPDMPEWEEATALVDGLQAAQTELEARSSVMRPSAIHSVSA